jgi:ABC-2 type transport system permease protein
MAAALPVTALGKPSASLGRPGPAPALRGLWAVVHRQWLLFIRYPTWIVSLFVWPVIFPFMYLFTARALAGPDGSGLAAFVQATGTRDFVGYIVVGTTVWMWQNISLWHIGFALRDDQLRGTLEANWLSPASRFSFLLGAGLLQGFVLAVFVAVAGLEYRLFFGVQFRGSLPLVLLAFLLAMPSIYGLGFMFASLVITAREANAIVFLVRGLVMVFSGVTFPVAVLPGWMQSVSALLPPTYVIRAVRAAALGGASLPQLLPDLLALAGFGLFWAAAGVLTFRWMERRARQTGAIGQY